MIMIDPGGKIRKARRWLRFEIGVLVFLLIIVSAAFSKSLGMNALDAAMMGSIIMVSFIIGIRAARGQQQLDQMYSEI